MVFVGTRRAFIAATVSFVLLACQRRPGESVTTVNVELGDYYIKPDKSEVPAGKVRFVAKNVGQLEHELIVLKTELAADQLPYNEKEQTAEEEQAGQVLGEIEPDELPPGKSAEMTLDLTAGHYVLLCNLPQHYKNGMYIDFRVR
ncbi:cupredoxin domain-containing protein [Thermomicrobium sp. CFH 73360]|uniref:cupredoxin domain-containing protein n=1 Tax=Thermomicrobium sp. CFH 73360 TaxID=2951987 RepID=UPI0020776A8D|nr:sulfocyanin-like copper-binding protein [Thermomicrobium sp. CFH 73360]MCM8747165.1 cupredoxin domain-containing protein [Thermomicrobium sp. CFH 73360]